MKPHSGFISGQLLEQTILNKNACAKPILVIRKRDSVPLIWFSVSAKAGSQVRVKPRSIILFAHLIKSFKEIGLDQNGPWFTAIFRADNSFAVHHVYD